MIKRITAFCLCISSALVLSGCCNDQIKDSNAVYLQIYDSLGRTGSNVSGYTEFKVLEEGDVLHPLFITTENVEFFGPDNYLLVLPIYANAAQNTFVLYHPTAGNDTVVVNKFNARAIREDGSCGFQIEIDEPQLAKHTFDSSSVAKFNAKENYLILNMYNSK